MPDKQDLDETTRDLAGRLPIFFETAPGTGNYRLLTAVAERFNDNDQDINDIDKATNLQQALAIEHKLVVPPDTTYVIEHGETEYWTDVVVHGDLEINGELIIYDAMGLEGLAVLGKLVDLPPLEGESAEHYRARLAAEFALITGEGTIRDFLAGAARVLNVDVANFEYEEPSGDEYGTVLIELPEVAVDESLLTESEIADILNRLLPASYRADAITVGTFTYITPEDYNNNDHDPSLGYDGLDANGDPKDNGGTYSGVLT